MLAVNAITTALPSITQHHCRCRARQTDTAVATSRLADLTRFPFILALQCVSALSEKIVSTSFCCGLDLGAEPPGRREHADPLTYKHHNHNCDCRTRSTLCQTTSPQRLGVWKASWLLVLSTSGHAHYLFFDMPIILNYSFTHARARHGADRGADRSGGAGGTE